MKNILPYTSLITLIALSLSMSCTGPVAKEDKPADPREQFRGRWRLLSIESATEDGGWKTREGDEGRQGFILYDGLGGMGVHHVPAAYQEYAMPSRVPLDSLSREDLAHYASQFIYFGRYSVDTAARTITHHIESDARPSRWNTEATRRYVFSGDTLHLMPVTDNTTIRINWIRMNDE